MIGKYFFNTNDCFTAFGITFNPGLYNQLLKLPTAKEGYSRNWPDQDGTERDLSSIKYESKTLNIQVTISASSEVSFYTKYNALQSFLLNTGYFHFDVVDMNRRFKLLFKSMSSFDLLTLIKNQSEIYAELTIVLVDDFPTEINSIPAP